MWAVIWLILKVILISIAAVIALIALAALLLLFVPFRYSANVKYEGEKLSALAKVKFLFGFLNARANFDEGIKYNLKMCGITLFPKKEKEKRKKSKKAVKKSGNVEKNFSKHDEMTENAAERSKEVEPDRGFKEQEAYVESGRYKAESFKDSSAKRVEIEKEMKPFKRDEAGRKSSETTEEESKKVKIAEKEAKKADDIKNENTNDDFLDKLENGFGVFRDKIEEVPEKISEKMDKTGKKYETLIKKKDAVLGFLNAAGTLEGTDVLIVSAKGLLKGILPKKLAGRLRFGTGDVYTEGKYLSYLCLLYGIYGGRLEIIPEWEESVIEADVTFSGRIILFTIVRICIKVLLDKKVKLLRRNFEILKRKLKTA